MAAMTRKPRDFVPWPSSNSKLSPIGSNGAVYRGTALKALVRPGLGTQP